MKRTPITTAMALFSIGISIVIVGTTAMIENPEFVHSLPTGINELLGIETAEQKSLPAQLAIEPILFCQDSDAGSTNVTGVTSVANQTTGLITTTVDYCANQNTLVEYSCSGSSQVTSAQVTCPYGCLSGRCMKQEEKGIVYLVHAIDTEAKPISFSSSTPTLTTGDFQPGGEVDKMMQDDFRNKFVDSFGGKIKISWFLQTQELFCHTNPANCTVVNDLMKPYASQIASRGDSIDWHSHFDDYASHTYPKPWWDQITTFNGTQYTHGTDKQIFEGTLSQLILQQQTFPSIYKAGWAWENTDLSNWLENVMPFDFSNISPVKNVNAFDPYENIYDWSRASQDWLPYHPSVTDYQVAGTMKRDIFRCIPTSASSLVHYAFQRASTTGMSAACFTTHSFGQPTKNMNLNNDIQNAKNAFPTVKFKYVTALEAAQAVKGYADTEKPFVTVLAGGNYFQVNSSEALFGYPYAAVKTTDGKYIKVQPVSVTPKTQMNSSDFQWLFDLRSVPYAQVTFAGSDYAGNTFVTQVFTPSQ